MVDELSRADIDAFLDTQVVGRVACHLDGETYIVPVIFAWSDDAVWVFTTEGKKVDFMRANPAVCFEVDERRDNGTWTSVIITGRYEELSGDDVTRTLSLLSSRFPPDRRQHHRSPAAKVVPTWRFASPRHTSPVAARRDLRLNESTRRVD